MDPHTVEFSTIVRAAPARVFEAITTSRGLDGWFTDGAQVEPRPGGTIRFHWKDWGVARFTGEAGGPVLQVEPNRKFAFQWDAHFADRAMITTVEWTLEAEERGTVVRVREGPFPDTTIGRRATLENAAGWGEALTLLKFFVEHGVRY